ncbi:hypothetical protein [Candidatus Kuenenia stuttgartiensis]|nr:hypothetical protein [Candidatus Kuenenia stuttgartiensis]
MAGSERAFDAAFKQSGVIRANTIEQLLIMPECLVFNNCQKARG